MNKNEHREETHLQRLRKNLEGLTFEQKIDHIFRYYWGTILIMILIPVALAVILVPILKGKPDFVFTGNCCNISLNTAGSSYLVNDWAETLNLDSGTYELNLKFSTTSGVEADDVDGGVQVAAAIAAQNLDYVICDSVAIEFFANQGAYLPLEDVLNDQTLSQWSDRIYSYTDETDGTTYNVALDVTQMPFFRASAQGSDKIYLIFANKEDPDIQRLNQFLSHLAAWEDTEQ